MERRGFLKQVTVALAGIAAGLGATPAALHAMNVRLGRPLSTTGEEHTYPVPAEDGATIDKENEIIVVRFRGKAYGFNLSCPHQHTALRWQPDDSQFQCPKHHSRYTPEGIFVSGRATRSMDRFGIRKDGSNLVIDVGKYYRQDQNRPEWEAGFVAV
ncbi:MAG: Rieske 2Fe-2S domain-containing protein [Gemmatimonadota bacterium]